MNISKRKKLEAKGFKISSVDEFLNLTPEESVFVEMKLALSKNLQKRRQEKNLSQTQLAQLIQSSQSRIAKMEAGDASVSLDLLVRSLLALGATRKHVSEVLMK